MADIQTTVTAMFDDAPRSGRRDPSRRKRWLILAVVALVQLMIVLDVSIVNIALPDAQKALGFSNGDRQWIVTAYSLAFGSLLLLFGRVSDVVGRRVMLLAGLCLFAGASFLGGVSPDFGVLVAARAVQGLGGAMMAPVALSVLTTTFTDGKERARAFAVFGAVAGSGVALGLLLGGVLTEYLDWRWTLFVNVGISVVAITGTLALIPRQRADAGRPGLDLPGTLLACAGLFSIVYGFSHAESHAWSTPGTWGFLAAGAVLIAAFTAWQTRAAHPLLPARVILDRNRGGAFLAIFLTGTGLFGIFLFLTYYLQENLGYSPVTTGVAFLPLVGALTVSAAVCTTRLLPRIGPRFLICGGMALAGGGLAWLTGITVTSGYGSGIVGPLVLVGLGAGSIFSPAMNTATVGVRARDAGVASAMVSTSQQIGGSIGTALLNSLANAAAARYLIGKTATNPLVQADATVHSYTVVFWWGAGIFAGGAILCGLLLRPGKPGPVDSSAAPAVQADGRPNPDHSIQRTSSR